MPVRDARPSLVAAAAALALLWSPAAIAQPARAHWVASWTGSPSSNKNPFVPTDVTIANQTVRQYVTLSRGGKAIRLVFSNEFGTTPVRIGAASVMLPGSGNAAPQRVALRFAGRASATMSPGAPLVSDRIALDVPDGARLEVRAFFPEPTALTTLHELGMDRVEVSAPGDFTATPELTGATGLLVSRDPRMKGGSSSRPFLTEVDVDAPDAVRTIVAFGDSITDGAGSTPGQDRRWPDLLAARVRERGLPLSIVNQGISGNQVLADGLGVSALARFDRDVLAKPGVSTVIVMEGINDIGFSAGLLPGRSRPEVIPAAEIIAGYRQLIDRAHGRGVRIVGATMTPFEGSRAYSAAKESVRQEVNDWIRRGGGFDAVIDFDAVLRDPAAPRRLQRPFDSGDAIHPSDAGYAAMANAVDLSLLR